MDYCYQGDSEPTIIFGGDACDRGQDGYQIMKELLDNPSVIYLKGNHEEMFCKAAREMRIKFTLPKDDREKIQNALHSSLIFDYKYLDIPLALTNGGEPTLIDWALDGMPTQIIQQLEKLHYTCNYEQYDFCHAGGTYPTFERVANCEYRGIEPDKMDIDAILWDRYSFNHGWASGRTVIHGHTPVPELKKIKKIKFMKNCPFKYEGFYNEKYTGAKIDMDTGVAFTNKIFVLNILTMKATGFELIKNDRVKQVETISL